MLGLCVGVGYMHRGLQAPRRNPGSAAGLAARWDPQRWPADAGTLCQLCLASRSHHGPGCRGTSPLPCLKVWEVHLTSRDTPKYWVLGSGLFSGGGRLERSRSWSLMSLSADGENCPQLGSLSPHRQGRAPVGRTQLNTGLGAV